MIGSSTSMASALATELLHRTLRLCRVRTRCGMADEVGVLSQSSSGHRDAGGVLYDLFRFSALTTTVSATQHALHTGRAARTVATSCLSPSLISKSMPKETCAQTVNTPPSPLLLLAHTSRSTQCTVSTSKKTRLTYTRQSTPQKIEKRIGGGRR